MNFCSECGSSAICLKIPQGDNLPRHICGQCKTVFYQNPKIVAGCILEWESKILLCQRAIEPRPGYWTVPAGFMEKSESVSEAAARESLEEACARSDALCLHSIYTLKHIDQVHVVYRGVLKDGKAETGCETLATMLCDESDIPWNEIAFPVVRRSLELYFQDRAQGVFSLHQGEITRDGEGNLQITDYVEFNAAK